MDCQRCPYCKRPLEPGASAAFCEENPNREAALARWRKGDRRYRYKAKRVVIGCLSLAPSPWAK